MARFSALCLALAGLAVVRGARADAALFLPGDDARRGAEEAELAAGLRRQLEALPGVATADVLVQLPRPAQLALDQSLPPAAVSVVLREIDRGDALGPRAEDLAQVLAVAGLGEHAKVSITRASVPPGAPIAVAAHTDLPPTESRKLTSDRVGLLASLLANVFLATVLLWRVPHRHSRETRRSKVS